MSLNDVPAFGPDDSVHVIVESTRGSNLKLKYQPEFAVFTLSRPLINGLTFPYDWGFVPGTRGPDGDPLDAMVLWDQSSVPGLVLSCRVIGALGVEQNSKRRSGTRERNDRLFVVPTAAPRANDLKDVRNLPSRLKEELEHFFLASTAFEHKDLKFTGWSGAHDAREIITSAVAARVAR
jgi:inorganic pyrophosphatase